MKRKAAVTSAIMLLLGLAITLGANTTGAIVGLEQEWINRRPSTSGLPTTPLQSVNDIDAVVAYVVSVHDEYKMFEAMCLLEEADSRDRLADVVVFLSDLQRLDEALEVAGYLDEVTATAGILGQEAQIFLNLMLAAQISLGSDLPGDEDFALSLYGQALETAQDMMDVDNQGFTNPPLRDIFELLGTIDWMLAEIEDQQAWQEAYIMAGGSI